MVHGQKKQKRGRAGNKPCGIRGGSWNNDASNLRVSDRNNAGWTNTDRNNNVGVRPAKTLKRKVPAGPAGGQEQG